MFPGLVVGDDEEIQVQVAAPGQDYCQHLPPDFLVSFRYCIEAFPVLPDAVYQDFGPLWESDYSLPGACKYKKTAVMTGAVYSQPYRGSLVGVPKRALCTVFFSLPPV